MLHRRRTKGELLLCILFVGSKFLADLFFVLLVVQRLGMCVTSVGLLWQGDTVADIVSCSNTENGSVAEAISLGSSKDLGIFLDMLHPVDFGSTKDLQIPGTRWKRHCRGWEWEFLVTEE